MTEDKEPSDPQEKLHSEFFPLFKKWNGYRESLDTEGIRESAQDILMKKLVAAGLVTEDHFWDLLELVRARDAKGKRMHLDRKIVEGLAGSETDKKGAYLREALRELDPSTKPGYFPYVEKHGLEIDDKDRYVYTVLEAWDRIGDEIQDTLELKERRVIGEMNKNLNDLFEFVFTDELLKKLGTSAEEIKKDIIAAWELIQGA